jgi:tellurite resistance protein
MPEQECPKKGICTLKYFPISFLSIVLGMIGFSLAVQRAEIILHLPIKISSYLLYLTMALFLVIAFTYMIKILRYPVEVKKELNHPIKLNFYPILAKIFLIYSIITLDTHLIVSRYSWYIGAILQLFFTIIILSIWLRHSKYDINHINPSWFIPIVGCIIVPIAGIRHSSTEVSWFFFSIGLVLWISLFVIILYRVIFHHPIPEKLIPTFFILFAPPAIGFISYVKLTGQIDVFARIMYYTAFFLMILVFAQVDMFSRIRFYLSWWAYSFPMAAITIATMLMYHMTEFVFFKIVSYILLALLSIIIFFLIIKTIQALRSNEICIEED